MRQVWNLIETVGYVGAAIVVGAVSLPILALMTATSAVMELGEGIYNSARGGAK